MIQWFKSPLPALKVYSTWHQPNLIGKVCDSDGKPLVDSETGGDLLLDLSDGQITWYPVGQNVLFSLFQSNWRRLEEGPSFYRLTFSKAADDPMGKWLWEHMDSLRFRIEDVVFIIVEGVGEMSFVANGQRVFQ